MPQNSGRAQEAHNELVLSFNAVRRALGGLGFALPILLLVVALTTDEVWQPSISEFYYGPGGVLFVGIMCALGVFLWSYLGYRDREPVFPSDKLMARIAGAAALGVAFVPTNDKTEPISTACTFLSCLLDSVGLGHSRLVHYICAAVFLSALGVMCLVNFRRMGKVNRDAAELALKQRKNTIFLNCGIVIFASVAALGAMGLTLWLWSPALEPAFSAARVVFWLETVAVWAFAWAWLVKGEVPFLLRLHGLQETADRP